MSENHHKSSGLRNPSHPGHRALVGSTDIDRPYFRAIWSESLKGLASGVLMHESSPHFTTGILELFETLEALPRYDECNNHPLCRRGL